MEIKHNFLKHKEEHNGVHVFTDGSQGVGVGYAAIFPNNNLSGGLVAPASIFTAELDAVKVAVDRVMSEYNPSRNNTIFSDSQSALQALTPKMYNSPLVQDIKSRVYLAGLQNIKINFCWVPAHCNILGNEQADKLAKEAASNTADHRTASIMPIPHTDMTAVIKTVVKKSWQSFWTRGDHRGQKLLEIKEEIAPWSPHIRRAEDWKQS